MKETYINFQILIINISDLCFNHVAKNDIKNCCDLKTSDIFVYIKTQDDKQINEVI